jgi:hypothetical protein
MRDGETKASALSKVEVEVDATGPVEFVFAGSQWSNLGKITGSPFATVSSSGPLVGIEADILK